tara:strand:+ start:350 stop:1312 length:963 start_codon:yes stop_codon:yes gene_type:complete
MATKLTSLISIVTGYFSNTQINSNFQTIATEFDKVVYRDGTTPNTMSADLDLNSKDLLNVAQTNTDTLYVAGTKVTATTASPSWKGPWVTATVYAIDDIVSTSGSSYICIVAHTAAATFTADLSAVKWQVMASVGASGAGTGDLVSTNNLSDVANATTARANLGAEIGVNVQAYDAVLQGIATAGSVAIAYLPEATTAQWRANTADKVLSTDQVWGSMTVVGLTDAASIVLTLSSGFDFSVTLAGDRTLANPTAVKVGQRGRIMITQDGTGTRTLAYGTYYKFAAGTAPVLTTTAGAIDVLYYDCISATQILVSPVLGLA